MGSPLVISHFAANFAREMPKEKKNDLAENEPFSRRQQLASKW